MQLPKAFFFDVFGTLVDWRTSIAREAAAILKPLGHSLDWLAFADAWRGEYQPAMEEIRAGRLPFCRLDVLHRRNLEKVLPRFKVLDLPEAVMTHLNLAAPTHLTEALRTNMSGGHTIATPANMSVSAPMCASGTPISQLNSGAQMMVARSSKLSAWKTRSTGVLAGTCMKDSDEQAQFSSVEASLSSSIASVFPIY